VLTANEPSKSAQRVREGWQATVARAPGARYTNVTTSRHYISIDRPDIVVEAILGVIDAIESSAKPADAVSDLGSLDSSQ
jgi:hypothetical protein